VRRTIAVLAALGLLAVLPVTAQAQDDIKLVISPSAPLTNSAVWVSLDGCQTPTAATSPGFHRPAKLEPTAEGGLRGVTHAVEQSGEYTATAECGGKSYSAQFTVVDQPPPSGWSFGPDEVEPGGTVTASISKFVCIPQPATSPGFTEPLGVSIVPPSLFQGSTKVIMTPGTYTATFRCSGNPTPLLRQFTIKAPPTTTTPPATTTPPGAKPKPKPPIVKPKGAPQTGGGGTA
jgi:hypothetical protein